MTQRQDLDKREDYRAAISACATYNCHRKEGAPWVTPADLLGDAPRRVMSDKEIMTNLTAMFGGKAKKEAN